MLSAEVCEEVISLFLGGAVYGFETPAPAVSFPLRGKHGDKAMRISREWSQNSYKSYLKTSLLYHWKFQ